MPIRQRVKSSPTIRWPEDWSDEELAKYFDDMLNVYEARHTSVLFGNSNYAEPVKQTILTQHKALKEVVKRLKNIAVLRWKAGEGPVPERIASLFENAKSVRVEDIIAGKVPSNAPPQTDN